MKLFYSFSLALFFLSTTACNQKPEEIGEVTDLIHKEVKKTIDQLSNNPSQPIDEVKKLSQVEYKSLTFPSSVSSEDLDKKLTELGHSRWNCFSASLRPKSGTKELELLVLCKRTPETVLRFIPRGLIGN